MKSMAYKINSLGGPVVLHRVVSVCKVIGGLSYTEVSATDRQRGAGIGHRGR